MTTLTLAVSRAFSRSWDEDSEIVVTELDHRANVDPWIIAAREKGAKVRWIGVDTDTLTLNERDIEQRITPNTRLVAVGLASNAVGTVNDVAPIAERAHAVGAVVAVDAVHAAPHIPLDRDGIGADVLTCSAYRFFRTARRSDGHQARSVRADGVQKLEPAPEYVPDKLETGTQNHEGIASFGDGGTPRRRMLDAMRVFEEHETRLADRLRAALREIPGIILYAAPSGVRKTPTVAFRLRGLTPDEVCEHALDRGYFIAAGDFYASTLAGRLGVGDDGGFVRPGSPRTTPTRRSRSSSKHSLGEQ